ncbi:hypothetical protein SRHO_G00256450 [Serrasalmus rhombeus]
MAEITPNPYRGGRADLVICETINTAEDICEELRGINPGETIIYCRSDEDSLSKIHEKLHPGMENGGIPRMELQAFGRTARKGEPGSAQVMTTDHLQEAFRIVSSLEEAKKTRDRLAETR